MVKCIYLELGDTPREETCSKLVSQRPPAPANLGTLTPVEGGLHHFKLWHVPDSSSIQAPFPPPHKGGGRRAIISRQNLSI